MNFGERERSAFEVNKAAANEIAHQIQLRNLSGLIIVDFVSMRRRDAQSRLGEIFRSALAADPLQPQLIGFTRLGLAEVTRRREGGSLQRIICGMPEEPISSPETTALAALRGVLIDSATSRRAVYGLRVHPAVASCLINEVESAFEETKTLLGGQLELTSDAAVERDNFYVEIIR